nr:interference hedgehog isoform X2 [Drosophila kikkawai]
MVPPSRPNVTRLSDEAVMLRWSVPQNLGLPIIFFKVQYRNLGDGKSRREGWQTTSDNIPYGNSHGWRQRGRERNRDRQRERERDRDQHEMGNAPKNFTSSVTGLVPGKYYRFRLVAVYSNDDNKEGNASLKFLLLAAGNAKSNLPIPELHEVEPVSETAVQLHWTLSASAVTSGQDIDGYYAYYRPAASAAEYLKSTVDGGPSRSFRIDQLHPGTTYEFKLQSFNADAASEFSAIRQVRTKQFHDPTTPKSHVPANNTAAGGQQQNSIYPVILGASGGALLLLIAVVWACLCLKRRDNSQPEDENKPQLEHIQADFVTSAVLGVGGHHKSGDVRRLNGVIPRMNITPNPLAGQEATSDKSHVPHQNGLHHAQPYHPPATPTLLHKRLDYHHQQQQLQHQQPPPVPPHSAYYQQAAPPAHVHGHQPSPMLERSVRSLQQQQHPGYHLEEAAGTPTPSRIPSLRRQRRTSGSQHNSHSNLNLSHHNNNNNNLPPHHQHLHLHQQLHHQQQQQHPGHVGIPIVPGSPRVQRSPMPSRAMIKRTRLGSHTDNISSGSLNSIEV